LTAGPLPRHADSEIKERILKLVDEAVAVGHVIVSCLGDVKTPGRHVPRRRYLLWSGDVLACGRAGETTPLIGTRSPASPKDGAASITRRRASPPE
jgi:hypothetical protein